MIDNQAALLAAIRVSPDDDTLRLAYADYLQEEGDDLIAEIVRLHVEFAKLPKWDGGIHVVSRRNTVSIDWREEEREKCSRWHSARVKLHHLYKKLGERSVKDCRDTIHFKSGKDCPGTDYRVAIFDSKAERDGMHTGRFVIASYLFSRGLCSHITCRWEYWQSLHEKILKGHPVSEVTLTTGVYFEQRREGAVLVDVPPYKAGTTNGFQYWADDLYDQRPHDVSRWLCERKWPGIKFNTRDRFQPVNAAGAAFQGALP